MGYLAFWQRTKRKFEEATGKKKPSETILGVFKKSTGLESACKDLYLGCWSRHLRTVSSST